MSVFASCAESSLGDHLSLASRLETMEKLLYDLHWCFIGHNLQMFQAAYQQIHGDSAIPPECSHPKHANGPQDLDIQKSSSSKRRQRAKALRNKLWSSLHPSEGPVLPDMPAADSSHVRCIASDSRRMPQHAWETIYKRFQKHPAQQLIENSPNTQLQSLMEDGSVQAIEFYPRNMVMVGVFVNPSRASLAIQVSREELKELLAASRRHSIQHTSFLERTYEFREASTCDSNEDMEEPEFSQLQLHSIIDMAVDQFWASAESQAQRVGITRHNLDNVAVSMKSAFLCDQGSQGNPIFSKSQVERIITLVSEECAKALVRALHEHSVAFG